MNTSYQPNAMTGRSTQLREAQRESGRCELSWTNCGSSPRAVNQTVYPVWSTRPERTCQVGFNVSSTLQEHSISVLTKCRARLWIQVVPRKTFSPWANKPRAFFTIFIYQGQKVVRTCTIRLLNLGSAKHEKVAIYVVNQRISNVCRIAGAASQRSNS